MRLKEAIQNLPPALKTKLQELEQLPYYQFKPRKDAPILRDEQASFLTEKFPGIAVALGGTGSGKSYISARKVTGFLMDTPPPEEDSFFWILSKNLDMTCNNCWLQNLKIFIPKDWIDSVHWYSEKSGHPRQINLKPHRNGNRWCLQFKSYDMGREALQGRSIVGFWLDEQVDHGLISELIGRTRKYYNPGSQIYSLTPLSPAPELEAIYNDVKAYPGWKFYHLSSEEACKSGHITQQYLDQIKQTELEELIETRLTGQFASFQGAIYRHFRPSKHVVSAREIPKGAIHYRGVDLGWNDPTAAVWGARLPNGMWYVYREYQQNKTLIKDHVEVINSGWKDHPAWRETYCDHDAQDRAEFAAHGLVMLPAWKDTITGGISVLQHLFKDDKIFIFEECKQLISTLRNYVWDAKKKDKPLDRDNHLCDAIRYMISSVERPDFKDMRVPKLPLVDQRKAPF